ncbi:hypothetical protein KIL84_010042, partial [Mauremys mutica]
NPAAPSLFPLVSSCGADASQDPVALGCLAKDFLPDSITFSWKDNKNASITNDIKKFPSVLNTAGTYTATTQLSVTASKAQEVFYCSATHPNGERTITVNSILPCTIEPRMTIRPPARDQFLEPNKTSTIICGVKNLCNQAVTLKWLKDGVEVSSGIHTVGPVSSGSNGYTLSSELTVLEKDWDHDRVYSCKVESKNFSDIRNISKSFECGGDCSPPEIYAQLIPPNFADIYIRKSAILTCKVINMQSTEGLNVIWTREDGKELKTSVGERKLQSNGRFSVDATTSVCADEWERGDKYTCKVTHPELIFPLKKILTKEPALTNPQRPTVELLQSIDLEKKIVTLKCIAYDHRPKGVTIKWQGKPHLASEPRMEDGPYRASHHFETTMDKWEEEANYTREEEHKDDQEDHQQR